MPIFVAVFFQILCPFIQNEEYPTPKILRPITFRQLKFHLYGPTTEILELNDRDVRLQVNNVIFWSKILVEPAEFFIEINVNDYPDVEQIYLYKEDMKLSINFLPLLSTNTSDSLSKDEINIVPNNIERLEAFKEDNVYGIYVYISLFCHGYTGYNCQFLMFENKTHATDFFSGKIVKKQKAIQIGLTSFNVIIDDDPCDTNKTCNNHGTCMKKSNGQSIYCLCDEPWTGEFCQYEKSHIDPEEFLFGEIRKICQSATPCQNQNICSDGGICLKCKDYDYCHCNRSLFSGRYCEKRCPEICDKDSLCVENLDGSMYCSPIVPNDMTDTKSSPRQTRRIIPAKVTPAEEKIAELVRPTKKERGKGPR